jgi:glucose/arabinose dehydrogenase
MIERRAKTAGIGGRVVESFLHRTASMICASYPVRIFIAAGLALCLATPATAQLRSTLCASGLTNPVEFVQDPIDPALQYVVEQAGRIRILRNGAVQPAIFLDISTQISAGGERGLLGLAFAPDYATSRRFYVNFTNPEGHTVVARFNVDSNNLANPATRFDLEWPGGLRYIVQPFANHNGGHLAFGPDRYLYIGMGDGGSGNDPDHLAQTPSTLLGKMLRIDVNVSDSDAKGYQIPPGNPFFSASGLPEIWSFGLRNPWKFSFDDPVRGGTGALIIGDVGQNAWEEIDYEPAGAGGRNYGWRNREGAHDNPNVMPLPPAFLPLIDPIFEYDRSWGQSISGGYVYRGAGEAYRGRYFFADFVRGRVWSIAIDPATGEAPASSVIEHTEELGGSVLGNISSFGVDSSGELYILNYSSGTIFKIVPPPGVPTGLRFVPPGA